MSAEAKTYQQDRPAYSIAEWCVADQGSIHRIFYGRGGGDLAKKADWLVFGLKVITADACDRMTFDEIDRLFDRAVAFHSERR